MRAMAEQRVELVFRDDNWFRGKRKRVIGFTETDRHFGSCSRARPDCDAKFVIVIADFGAKAPQNWLELLIGFENGAAPKFPFEHNEEIIPRICPRIRADNGVRPDVHFELSQRARGAYRSAPLAG